MKKSITYGETSNPVTRLNRPGVAPEKVRIWLKVDEPMMIRNTIAVTRVVPSTALLRAFHVKQR